MSAVTVVGSANVDSIYLVERIALPGETVSARGLSVAAGGKGLNQAIAAHRHGALTTLIAAVGSDSHAHVVLRALADDGMESAYVRRLPGPTGSATIAVQDNGENSIMVLPGANSALNDLTPSDVEQIRQSRVVVCQLEIPMSTVVSARKLASDSGALFILNPSPVRDLDREFLSMVDVVTVNEHEASILQTSTLDLPCVIETRGSEGVVVRRRGHPDIIIPARQTAVVDTTGAGDTFVGVLAAELAGGVDVVDAARRGVIAASLAVERRGAVPSIPYRSDVDRALARAG